MAQKKILIFSLAYYPQVGGAEVALKEITDRISPEDIAFDMITLRPDSKLPDVETIGNVRVYRVKGLERLGYIGKVLFPLFAAVGAYKLNRQNHYDALWAMMSYMLFPIIVLRMFGLRIPYVLTLQEGDSYEHMFKRIRVMPFMPLLTYGFRHASVVQSISTFLGTWARKRKFTGPLEVVPNGVDFKKFTGSPTPHEGVVLITASRLVHKNAIDDVIRALALLPQDIRFKVLGVGSEESDLRALARECGVESRVEFAGYVSHAHLPAELHKADIFIRPSRSEGMGNSFVEAMAAGIPVIATQEGGIADFLFDARRNPDKKTTGWAVDTDSPKQIAKAVEEILGNPAGASEVIQNAQELVGKSYNWDLVAIQMRERVFSRVLKNALQ